MHFQIIQHNSPLYQKAVALRQDILRTPLGLCFLNSELESECHQLHIVGCLDEDVVCCASLMPQQDFCKVRQVAVKANQQHLGIGTKLMQFCEQEAKNLGFKRIELHARLSALNFYLKQNYIIQGEVFIEVNLPHRKMYKNLENEA